MSVEMKFACIAWREVTHSSSFDPEDIASALLSGFIGELAVDKADYLSRGQGFIDRIDILVDLEYDELQQAIDDADARGDKDAVARLEEVQVALIGLRIEANNVNLDLFLKILADDWDERHEDEEDAEKE